MILLKSIENILSIGTLITYFFLNNDNNKTDNSYLCQILIKNKHANIK